MIQNKQETTALMPPQVTSSLDRIRTGIANEAVQMSTAVSELTPTIEKYQTALFDTVAKLETELKGQMDSLSIESLYKPLAPDTEDVPSMLRVYTVIREYSQHLRFAINNFEDEIVRETEMTVFQKIVYEFDYITSATDNFSEVNTALKVALFSQNTKPFTKEQLLALEKILNIIENNISIPQKVLMEIINLLDDHFKLAGPLAEVAF